MYRDNPDYCDYPNYLAYKSAQKINRQIMETLANDALDKSIEKAMLASPKLLAEEILKVLKKNDTDKNIS